MKNVISILLIFTFILIGCNSNQENQTVEDVPETVEEFSYEFALPINVNQASLALNKDVTLIGAYVLGYEQRHGTKYVFFNNSLRSVGFYDEFHRELTQDEVDEIFSTYEGIENQVPFSHGWTEENGEYKFTSLSTIVIIDNKGVTFFMVEDTRYFERGFNELLQIK